MKDEKTLYVGVVGYSAQEFDKEDAKDMLDEAFETVEQELLDDQYDTIAIVSGGTDIGIPKLAYELADDLDYETISVIPEEANEYPLYEVDQILYEGEKFGDESNAFIDMIDILIKVGGGKQSQKEYDMAEEKGITTIEYELDSE